METQVLSKLELKERVTKRYLDLHRLYKDTNKIDTLRQAESKFMIGDYEGVDKILDTLNTREQLMLELMKHLEHKSVHRTLEKIMNGKTSNLFESLKGLFSLGTHICIELEKGHMEYRGLLDEVLDSIQRNLK